MQTKTLLKLIMSDLMANLYEKSQSELQITGTFVSYLTFNELLRLSYSCKRIYIVMGDLRVLQKFQLAARSQTMITNEPEIRPFKKIETVSSSANQLRYVIQRSG